MTLSCNLQVYIRGILAYVTSAIGTPVPICSGVCPGVHVLAYPRPQTRSGFSGICHEVMCRFAYRPGVCTILF